MRKTTAGSEAKEPIITKSFAFAFLASFSGTSIVYMLVTTISEYAQTFGATKTVAGLVSSIFLIGGLITRLLFGRMVCRFGWKKMIAFAMTVQFLACCMYFFISNIYQLIAVRLIHGCFSGMSACVGSTTGQYLIPKSRYGEGNGFLMMANALSVCFGPLAGGLLYDNFGSQGCFIASMVLAFIMAAGIFLARAPYPDLESFRAASNITGSRPDNETETGPGRENGTNGSFKSSVLNKYIEKDAVPAAICIFFCGIAYSCVLSFIRLFGRESGLSDSVSVFFVVYAVVLIFSRPSVGKLQDRRGDNLVVYPCVFMQIVSFLLLFIVPNHVTVLIAAVLLALGYGTLSSVFITIACRNTPYERVSYAVVTYWIAIDSSVGIGPIILGAVAENKGYGSMFFSAAIITAAVLPIYYLLYHKKAAERKNVS